MNKALGMYYLNKYSRRKGRAAWSDAPSSGVTPRVASLLEAPLPGGLCFGLGATSRHPSRFDATRKLMSEILAYMGQFWEIDEPLDDEETGAGFSAVEAGEMETSIGKLYGALKSRGMIAAESSRERYPVLFDLKSIFDGHEPFDGAGRKGGKGS